MIIDGLGSPGHQRVRAALDGTASQAAEGRAELPHGQCDVGGCKQRVTEAEIARPVEGVASS